MQFWQKKKRSDEGLAWMCDVVKEGSSTVVDADVAFLDLVQGLVDAQKEEGATDGHHQ